MAAHTGSVHGLVFSPDGKRLASAGRDAVVRLWSVPGGRKLAELTKGHTAAIRSLAWSPDGKTLASWGLDANLCLWNGDGTLRKTLTREGSAFGLAFSGDSKTLLAGDALLDPAGGAERVRFTAHPINPTRSAAFSSDGRRAAWGGSTRLFLWKTGDGAKEYQLGHGDLRINAAAWRPDGKGFAWRHNRAAGQKEKQAWRSFDLVELELGGMPPAGDTFARHRLGDLSLEQPAKGQLVVKRGKEVVRTLKTGDVIFAYTFLDDRRVIVGAARGVHLYDVVMGKYQRSYKGVGAVHAVAPSADNRWFVTGGIDRVLRVWSPERDRPLLLLYAIGHDWIAWTPEGYYAASPGGERLMGWQVNNGPNKLATFYPAAQFRKSLYRPDVIGLVLEAGDTRKALELANRASKKGGAFTDVEQVLPPKAAIVEVLQVEGGKVIPLTAEKPAVEVAGADLVVRAVAGSAGKHPVKEVLLLVDGRPYQGKRGLRSVAVPQKGDVERKWDVTLTAGTHQLAVVARSDVSSATSAVIEVTYRPAKPPAAPDPRPTLHTLFMGVNAYKGDLKLDFAVNDAKGLNKTLLTRSQPLFKHAPPRLLTDAEMTPARVFKELEGLKKAMTPKDVAVIFYAGHGHQDADGRFYMLPINMDVDNLEKTAVPGNKLKDALAELPGRTVLLIDACHGGKQKRKPGGGWTVKRQGPTDGLARELADDDCGVVVMCAAMGHEESREDADAKHGYFTLALIEGLSGKADYNGDGLITLTELELYVEGRVAQLSRDLQHPVTARPSSVRSFALARPGKP